MRESALLAEHRDGLDPLPELRGLIAAAIADEPPVSLPDGGVIRRGYHEELDELRSVRDGAVDWIAGLQARERERTGIPSLKIGFNKVFGYYLEVTRANLQRVPDDYQRKQTLANAERYFTPELKEWEEKVLGAEERIRRARGPRLRRGAPLGGGADARAAAGGGARSRRSTSSRRSPRWRSGGSTSAPRWTTGSRSGSGRVATRSSRP